MVSAAFGEAPDQAGNTSPRLQTPRAGAKKKLRGELDEGMVLGDLREKTV